MNLSINRRQYDALLKSEPDLLLTAFTERSDEVWSTSGVTLIGISDKTNDDLVKACTRIGAQSYRR